jgi:hypothetical protein
MHLDLIQVFALHVKKAHPTTHLVKLNASLVILVMRNLPSVLRLARFVKSAGTHPAACPNANNALLVTSKPNKAKLPVKPAHVVPSNKIQGSNVASFAAQANTLRILVRVFALCVSSAITMIRSIKLNVNLANLAASSHCVDKKPARNAQLVLLERQPV